MGCRAPFERTRVDKDRSEAENLELEGEEGGLGLPYAVLSFAFFLCPFLSFCFLVLCFGGVGRGGR